MIFFNARSARISNLKHPVKKNSQKLLAFPKNHSALLAEMSDVEVDRDEDMSPQPTNVHYNGKDGGYLEVPPDGMPVLPPPPTNHSSLPGSPQKKLIQPIMEKVVEEESSPIQGESSHTLPNNEVENNSVADR